MGEDLVPKDRVISRITTKYIGDKSQLIVTGYKPDGTAIYIVLGGIDILTSIEYEASFNLLDRLIRMSVEESKAEGLWIDFAGEEEEDASEGQLS